jgi:hypothetical protein
MQLALYPVPDVFDKCRNKNAARPWAAIANRTIARNYTLL